MGLKCYSKDSFQRGRVRVQMVDDKGQPLHETVKTRKDFLLFCGEKIPQLKKRKEMADKQPKEIKADPHAFPGAGAMNMGGAGGLGALFGGMPGGGGTTKSIENAGGEKKKKGGKKKRRK